MRIPLLELIQKSTEELRSQGLKESVIRNHRAIWWKYYGFQRNEKVFSAASAKRFLKARADTAFEKTGKRSISSEFLRAMNMLSKSAGSETSWRNSDFADSGPVKKQNKGSRRKLKLNDRLARKLDEGF